MFTANGNRETAWVHPRALSESRQVEAGTRIGAFAHVCPGAIISRDRELGDHCYVEGGVVIGDRVVVGNGASICAGVTLGDEAFVGPNVVFTNNLSPRAQVHLTPNRPTTVCSGASVGAGATVLAGITIGSFAMAAAGAVVTRDVPDFAIVRGGKAQVSGWACHCGRRLQFNTARERGARCNKCDHAYRLVNHRVHELPLPPS